MATSRRSCDIRESGQPAGLVEQKQPLWIDVDGERGTRLAAAHARNLRHQPMFALTDPEIDVNEGFRACDLGDRNDRGQRDRIRARRLDVEIVGAKRDRVGAVGSPGEGAGCAVPRSGVERHELAPPAGASLFLPVSVMTSDDSLLLLLRRLDELERKLDCLLDELRTPTAIGYSARRGNRPRKD